MSAPGRAAALESLRQAREPGAVLAAAERAGLLRSAGDVPPLERAGAAVLLRVLVGLDTWQGPSPRQEAGASAAGGEWAGYFDVSGRTT